MTAQASNSSRCILLTGISGSGKTTLGRMLVEHFQQFGTRPAVLLDGDSVRSFFENDLGFDPQSRSEVSKRLAFGAFTLVENNIDVVMANIAPARTTRNFFRKKFRDYVEVYLKVDAEIAKRKDVKGVYGGNSTEPTKNLVGIDLPYEEPEAPDLVIEPHIDSPEQSLKKILNHLKGRGPVLGTKADTLESLAGYTSHWKVLPQFTLSLHQFNTNPIDVLGRIRLKLGNGPYILRSSCRSEDSKLGSNAGAFLSLPGIPSERSAFGKACERVADSYREKGVERFDHEQILVQPMVTDALMSGVIFSRYRASDSPYYVINYDDTSRATDAVTGGTGGKVVFASRGADEKTLGKWSKWVEAVRELERFFPKFPLDIEFVESQSLGPVLLQCRALNVEKVHASLESSALEVIEELKQRWERASSHLEHIPGSRTILSDMADWNPSEMIGDKPNSLAYSLYRELITDETWHLGRAQLGYFSVVSGNLMLSMARKPYIDTRLSFASFTPANLPEELREKWVNHCLNTLERQPQSHDKVEFDILLTCLDFSTAGKLSALTNFSEPEKMALFQSLHSLTDSILLRSNEIFANSAKQLARLNDICLSMREKRKTYRHYWEHFEAAHILLDHTRRLGVLPFTKLARLGFIAQSFVRSMVEKGILTQHQQRALMASIPTVAGRFTKRLGELKAGKLEKETFLTEFGHLRMSTYDITSPRYDQLPDEMWKSDAHSHMSTTADEAESQLPIEEMSRALATLKLRIDPHSFIGFIRLAIQAREEAKFHFTRGLSEALEYLASAGETLGVSRDELQFTTLQYLLRFRNPERTSEVKASNYLRQRIGEKVHERSVFDLIKLPSVIASTKDIEVVELAHAKPNFISQKKVLGSGIHLNPQSDPAKTDIAGKIVVIENADPGYDWIFTRPILGLVTKYGGVASHMAIRCAEFDLPGAIGCGEIYYSEITKSDSILLDCRAEILASVG